MPMETLDIGEGPYRSRLARVWDALSPAVRRAVVVAAAVALGIGAGVALARSHGDLQAAGKAAPEAARTYSLKAADGLGPPPWAQMPRHATEPAFALVNRTARRVFVSTPPRFVFTIPPHQRLLFARAPVCTYQSFTARFRHGPPLGTIHDFCSANRWVVLPPGEVRLR